MRFRDRGIRDQHDPAARRILEQVAQDRATAIEDPPLDVDVVGLFAKRHVDRTHESAFRP